MKAWILGLRQEITLWLTILLSKKALLFALCSMKFTSRTRIGLIYRIAPRARALVMKIHHLHIWPKTALGSDLLIKFRKFQTLIVRIIRTQFSTPSVTAFAFITCAVWPSPTFCSNTQSPSSSSGFTPKPSNTYPPCFISSSSATAASNSGWTSSRWRSIQSPLTR